MQPDRFTVTTRRRVIHSFLLFAGLVAAPVGAHEPVDPSGLVPGHPTGHVHDRADQTWPPQPRGLRNEVLLGNPATAERAADLRRRKVADKAQIALGRAEVRRALGRRHSPPELVEGGGKAAGSDPSSRLVYFSHTNNSTVEVTFDRSRVRSVRRIPPTEYQPDVTDEEIASAEAIARQFFGASGTTRVAALKAYGILAHQPEGRGFYPTRVIYLTFHEDDDAAPEYAAWIDLSQQRVIRTREEQR